MPDLFGGHLIFPDAVEPANVGLYLAMIGLEAAIFVEHGLWQAIYIDEAVDMQRFRLELLYDIEIQRLILREMARAIKNDALYLPLQAHMIHEHFAPLFA